MCQNTSSVRFGHCFLGVLRGEERGLGFRV